MQLFKGEYEVKNNIFFKTKEKKALSPRPDGINKCFTLPLFPFKKLQR